MMANALGRASDAYYREKLVPLAASAVLTRTAPAGSSAPEAPLARTAAVPGPTISACTRWYRMTTDTGCTTRSSGTRLSSDVVLTVLVHHQATLSSNRGPLAPVQPCPHSDADRGVIPGARPCLCQRRSAGTTNPGRPGSTASTHPPPGLHRRRRSHNSADPHQRW